jgi:hypothetical protein
VEGEEHEVGGVAKGLGVLGHELGPDLGRDLADLALVAGNADADDPDGVGDRD